MHYDKETKRYFQISLISHGFTVECLPGFTATTNLTQHYEWIENIVRGIHSFRSVGTKLRKYAKPFFNENSEIRELYSRAVGEWSATWRIVEEAV